MSILLFFVLSLSVTPTIAFVNCRQNITETDNLWNCSDTLTLDFPQTKTLPDGVQSYDLSLNRIQELHRINSTCKQLHSCRDCLRNLYLQHNLIDTIDNYAFLNLHCLHTLDLSHNRIHGDRLSTITFEGLLQLEELSLRGNPLLKLEDFALNFNELRLLRKLDLSSCQISYIADLALADISLLEDLNLSDNNLQSVHPLAFHGLYFLEDLDLRRNKLPSIEASNFRSLIKLKRLYLDHNQIEILPEDAFDGLENLELLSMSNNWLQGIPYHSMKGLQSLNILNVNANHIMYLRRSEWPKDEFLRLRELRMDNMHGLWHIDTQAFASFPLLRRITITGNPRLKHIPDDAFVGNTQFLKEVYLHDNQLQVLPRTLLPWKNLDVLDLHDNAWMCDCRLRWMIEEAEQFKGLNLTIRCHLPEKLKGSNMLELSAAELRCPRSFFWIVVTLSAGLGLLVLVVTVIVALRYKRNLPCGRNPVSGRYVTAYTRDFLGDEEGTANICLAEDEVPLKEAEV